MKKERFGDLRTPDPSITLAELEQYGFENSKCFYMLPLRTGRAYELFEAGAVVYALFSNGIAVALDNVGELSRHAFREGLFGIKPYDWQNQQFRQQLLGNG